MKDIPDDAVYKAKQHIACSKANMYIGHVCLFTKGISLTGAEVKKNFQYLLLAGCQSCGSWPIDCHNELTANYVTKVNVAIVKNPIDSGG